MQEQSYTLLGCLTANRGSESSRASARFSHVSRPSVGACLHTRECWCPGMLIWALVRSYPQLRAQAEIVKNTLFSSVIRYHLFLVEKRCSTLVWVVDKVQVQQRSTSTCPFTYLAPTQHSLPSQSPAETFLKALAGRRSSYCWGWGSSQVGTHEPNPQDGNELLPPGCAAGLPFCPQLGQRYPSTSPAARCEKSNFCCVCGFTMKPECLPVWLHCLWSHVHVPTQTVRPVVPSLRLPAFVDTAKVLHQLEYFN